MGPAQSAHMGCRMGAGVASGRTDQLAGGSLFESVRHPTDRATADVELDIAGQPTIRSSEASFLSDSAGSLDRLR